MNIKTGGKQEGWILILLLFLVFVVVMGIIFCVAYRACKKVDENIKKQRDDALSQAWDEAIAFGSNYNQQVGGEHFVVELQSQEERGYGIITSSTNGSDWETNGTTSSIAAAYDWQANWQANTPPPTNSAMFYRVLVVVTNQ